MPETIASYFVMSERGRAKASEMNENFSNHRGSIIPISETTQTGANDSYEFGGTGKFFLNAYSPHWHFGKSSGGQILINDTTIAGYPMRPQVYMTSASIDMSAGSQYFGTYFARGAPLGITYSISGSSLGLPTTIQTVTTYDTPMEFEFSCTFQLKEDSNVDISLRRLEAEYPATAGATVIATKTFTRNSCTNTTWNWLTRIAMRFYDFSPGSTQGAYFIHVTATGACTVSQPHLKVEFLK